MKLLLEYILVLFQTKFIVCQNQKKHVVLCREKFTQKTIRNDVKYTGCLINKSNTTILPR